MNSEKGQAMCEVRYLRLHESLDAIREVRADLRSFRDEIRSVLTEPDKVGGISTGSEITRPPKFEEVINETPEIIQALSVEMRELIAEIRSVIF